MKVETTIEKAIIKGKLMLIFLPAFIFLGTMGLLCFLGQYNDFGGYIYPFSIILGFLLCWLTWSFMITKWRIWAFENVRNVHELKRKAIQHKLIWKEKSFFEKTEIRTLKDREILKRLEKKFLVKDVYRDDISVAKETRIFYSKTQTYAGLIVSGALIFLGIYLLINEKLMGLVSFPLAVFLIYKESQKLKDKSEQIIINSKGIQIRNIFYPWKNIYNENVIVEIRGKHVEHYLAFETDFERPAISINMLGVSLKKLEKLLQVYRIRYEKGL